MSQDSRNDSFSLFNRQRNQPVDLRLLRQIIRHLLIDQLKLKDFDITLHLVNAAEITRLNETLLGHNGSTDVITLDYLGASKTASAPLAGEIFVCVDEALIQARLFRVTWQAELVRYIIHGVLHLQGYDDTRPAACRLMKREEVKRLTELGRDFRLSKLRRKPKVPA
jgi:probable rRNA maturation factor